ncbi:MAG: sialate O-acetylesterase [Clostridia bacterium]|nr:sialate O-acetylesterase [Clostridia bacterium]
MELASIFSDNTVLQAEKPVRFFGTGKGKIAITLGDRTYERDVLEDRWVMELPAQPYGGTYDVRVRLQDRERLLKNVTFGDVFLCAGQSNMQFEIGDEKGAAEVRDDPGIRYFVSDRIEAYVGQRSADGWTVCKKSTAGNWSALGLHVAERYRKKYGVPVGIVGCFQGASAIRSWLPESELDESVYVPIEERHFDSREPLYADWNGDGVLYRRTFSPVAPFAFKGVIWYQGESDTTVAEGKVYTRLLTRLIGSWRRALRDNALPFTVVEICDYDVRGDEGWRAIQACQQAVAGLTEGVTVVTSKDVCEHANIHPCNKEDLAEKIVGVM